MTQSHNWTLDKSVTPNRLKCWNCGVLCLPRTNLSACPGERKWNDLTPAEQAQIKADCPACQRNKAEGM